MDGRTISAYQGDLAEAFRYGLAKFLEEAWVLARFAEHQGIMVVRDFFFAHSTGYWVMSYLEERTVVYEQYNDSAVYRQAQAEAQQARRGIWEKPGGQQDPAAWRRLNPR